MLKTLLIYCLFSTTALAATGFGPAKNPLEVALSSRSSLDIQQNILALINSKAETIQNNVEQKLRSSFGTKITYFFPDNKVDHFVIDDEKIKNGKIAWLQKQFITSDNRTCRLTIMIMLALDETTSTATTIFADLPSKHFPGDTDIVCATPSAKLTNAKDLIAKLPKSFI